MAPIAVLTTAFLPNGNFRTLKKSAIDLLNASFEEETLGKHPKAVYLNGSAIADPRFVHFEVVVSCLRPKLGDKMHCRITVFLFVGIQQLSPNMLGTHICNSKPP